LSDDFEDCPACHGNGVVGGHAQDGSHDDQPCFECCGQGVVGAEYGGMQEVICCGNYVDKSTEHRTKQREMLERGIENMRKNAADSGMDLS
jgi:hypothetical protein